MSERTTSNENKVTASEAAAWVLLLSRWAAAHYAARWLARFRTGSLVIAVIGLILIGLAWPADPNWPFVVSGVIVLLVGIIASLTCTAGVWALHRLALSRKARPVEQQLSRSKDQLLGELAATGVPVSGWAAARMVLALASGRRPEPGTVARLREVAGHLDAILDADSLRNTLRSKN